MSLLRRRYAGAVVAIALSGCSDPPPPDPPPQPTPQPVEEPPPPPKCEALDEGCAADAGTEVPIPGSTTPGGAFVFTPPTGWTYAKRANATVAQKSDTGAVLVISAFDPPDASRELAKKRDALAVELAAEVGLERKKPAELGSANQQAEMAGLKMSLWEKPGAKRGDAEGAILVFSADAEGKQIFGLGYAPSDDTEGTAAILEALESIRKEASGDESK